MSKAGSGLVVGKPAPDFSLANQYGAPVSLSDIKKQGPALLVFYPGDFQMVCTEQLCNYRDNMDDFNGIGVQVYGVSKNSSEDHLEYAKHYDLPFPLLSDVGNRVAKLYDCTSILMLGGVSRAICIINSKGILLYRYVEPTIITRRKAQEIIGILRDLKSNQLL